MKEIEASTQTLDGLKLCQDALASLQANFTTVTASLSRLMQFGSQIAELTALCGKLEKDCTEMKESLES